MKTLFALLLLLLLAGCATQDTDRPDNQMRKSPCACLEVDRG